MKHSLKLIIAAFFVLIAAQKPVFSQELSLPGDGKDFWVGYMYPSYNNVAAPATTGFYSASLLISSYSNNNVSVNFFDPNTGAEVPAGTYFVAARTAIQVPMPLTFVKMSDTNGDVPEYKACHVTAKRPINVEFFSTGACSGGSFLPITSAGLGTKYVIASYGDNPGDLGILGNPQYGPRYIEDSHGFFEIIAPYDGTTVTIVPNSTTMGGHPGFHSGSNPNPTFPNKSPYSVSLARGQCYLVRSKGNQSDDDISGSTIVSTKPVAVIAGQENGALGGVTNRNLEGRDFMVEQMYPTTLWDTTGYVMIPLKDSQPADATLYDGVGEDYRTYSDSSACINLTLGSVSGPIQMSTAELAQPPPERFGVTEPVDFESCNGQKFSVMMYDLRNFANSAPYPAPSMITVIPISRWRTSFLWYVPANKFEILQGYYVDIIAPTADLNAVSNGIVGSFNGGQIKPIKQILNMETQWKGSIPNYPQLTGVRFKLNPGCYYAHGPNPFMCYNFGFRALDPNFDLGDFDYDDYFFSYGLPVGMRLGSSPHIRVAVDTFCSYWHVCAFDTTYGLSNQGIKQVDLMDDPTGDAYDLHPSRAVVYHNTYLDPTLDPDHLNSILFSGDDTMECFNVYVANGTDTGYAPLFIVDDQGGAVMAELHYAPPAVKLTPDTGRYLGVVLTSPPTDSCNRYVFKNTAKFDPSNPKKNPFNLDTAYLKQNNPHYNISSIVPKLPATLYAGDSVVFTACFTPSDTTTQLDTLLIKGGCIPIPIDLKGNAVIPIIWASDHDFGSVLVDSTKCDTVGVYNIGKAPFTLTKNWVLDNFDPTFSFSAFGTAFPKTYGSNDLPITLNPGQKVLLRFCYTPTAEQNDTTTQFWGTTLEAPYQHSNKDLSKLSGAGVRTGFVWDRSIQPDTVICADSEIVRVYLINNASGSTSPAAHVDSVYFRGPDVAEFYVLRNQLGFAPATNFSIKAGDSVWFDVVFKANLNDVPKYHVRHAQLVAVDVSEKEKIIDFSGNVLHADPNIVPTSLNYGDVVLGVTNTRGFTLFDTGNTPLIVTAIKGVSLPVLNVNGIAPGTAIAPYDTVNHVGSVPVTVSMVLGNFVDTTVVLEIDFQTPCSQPMFETLHIAASFINPTNTGHNFDSVFLVCRPAMDTIFARNLGTKPLGLREIDIINQVPNDSLTNFAVPPQFFGNFTPPQFQFDNGSQQLIIGANDTLYKPGRIQGYPIHFRPTRTGWDTVTVICHWDSAGYPKTSMNLLIGYGRLEYDTLSPVQPTYANKTALSIDVPITLTKSLPKDVQAFGITFKVKYRRDVLNLITSGSKWPDYNPLVQDYSAATSPLPPVDDAAGNEIVTYTLKSSSALVPITTLTPIVTMHFQVMVAKEVATPITITDAVFWGQNPQDTLCYVINSEKAATFDTLNSCGDGTLRTFLNGIKPTRIVAITPNPAIDGLTPAVTYAVNVDKLPITIELFNALGERIRTIATNVVQAVGEHSIPIGVRDLPNGLYILRITSPDDVESGQFLIQK
jgi:hypothetical protein